MFDRNFYICDLYHMTQSKFDEAAQLYRKAGQEQKVTLMNTHLCEYVCAYLISHWQIHCKYTHQCSMNV